MEDAPSALPAYVASIVRTVAGPIGGYLIGKGYLTADQAPEVAGLLVVLATGIWSFVQKVNAHKALKAAVAAPSGQAS